MRFAYLRGLFVLPLLVPVIAVRAAAQAAAPSASRHVSRALAEKETTLPMRSVSLYKNGVGFFEQAGEVDGNELVQIDLTTAQLNDVLQSLTAVDLGDGRVLGAGYGGAAPLLAGLNGLAPGLGANPTVTDFLRAMKGTRVEVRTGGRVFPGRLLNVEVRNEPEGNGSGVMVERRYVSIVNDAGGLRTFELTPSVEVRVTGNNGQEIGQYLQLLAASHEPSVRQLMLEDRGTGKRELHVSYISSMPAWKSTYRILFTGGNGAGSGPQKATLQGWAVIDNTSGSDWKDVQLTLVSGAPQSFIQQISRPLDVLRPVIPMPGQPAVKYPRGRFGMIGAMADPIGAGSQSVPVNASLIGGGMGVQVSRAPAPMAAQQPVSAVDNYESAADKTSMPQTTSVDLDDLFEYKLSKPISIQQNDSAMVPILETELAAERVTVWDSRENGGAAMRSLWLTNSSNLTLDRGAVTIVENGVFAGQAQMDPMHPKERQMMPYAVDGAVSVEESEGEQPKPVAERINTENGELSVHRFYERVRNYTITNAGNSARVVVLEPERTDRFRMKTDRAKFLAHWDLAPDMPKPVAVAGDQYYFEVPVAPEATATFKLLEVHAHPTHYDIAAMSEDDLQGILDEAGGNAEVAAKLQPILDAKRKIAAADRQLKANQRGIDGVKDEEKRIRENMASINSNDSAEKSLAKRYADEMNEQEDKLATLQQQRDALLQQKHDAQQAVSDEVAALQMNVKLKVS